MRPRIDFLFRRKWILIFTLIAQIGQAAPLGTIPTIEETNLRFILSNTSDLWTSPYRNKSAPVRIYESEFRAPLVRGYGWVGSFAAKAEGVSIGRSDITLGEDQVFLGSDFRSQSVGVGFTRDLDEKSSFTFFMNYVSASDEVWRDQRDRWVEGSAIYRAPESASHRWIVLVDYTRNRGFLNDRPFAYLGVLKELSPTTTLVYGFPFFRAQWGEEGDWKKMLTITPVYAQALMKKNLTERYQVHFLAAFETRSYLHANRISDKKRIFLEDGRIETGFQTDLSTKTNLSFDLGWAFDRFIYEGETIFARRGSRYRLPGDIFGTIRLEFQL